jgi:large subunit ribosomal protein L25
MEHKVLTAEKRKPMNKGENRRLRNMGKIPAIVYGSHEPKCVAIDDHEFRSNFKTMSESTIIELKQGSDTLQVLIKDYQKDIVSGQIRHIDFYEIEKGKALKTNISLRFEGSPVGVREGGILEHKREEVEVECLPKDLPPEIIVDISALAIGDSIHVSELPELEGVKILTSEESTVAVVTHAKVEVVEPEEGEEGLEEGLEEGEESAEETEESSEE